MTSTSNLQSYPEHFPLLFFFFCFFSCWRAINAKIHFHDPNFRRTKTLNCWPWESFGEREGLCCLYMFLHDIHEIPTYVWGQAGKNQLFTGDWRVAVFSQLWWGMWNSYSRNKRERTFCSTLVFFIMPFHKLIRNQKVVKKWVLFSSFLLLPLEVLWIHFSLSHASMSRSSRRERVDKARFVLM